MYNVFVCVNSVFMFVCRILTEASRVYDVLDDILEHVLSSMHIIQKSLQFWQLKAEVQFLFQNLKTKLILVHHDKRHMLLINCLLFGFIFREQMLKKHTSWFLKEDHVPLSMERFS